MKKYLVYMTCAAAAMIGGTGCSDFGDVNMDPEHLNSENIPTELLFTNGQHQMLGSDWDVWRNGCIYAAQWMSHTASFNWLGNANYTWNDGYSGAYWEIYNGDTRGALRDMKDAVEAWKEDPSRQTDYQIARIMLAYGMHRMTDLYGDIPYSQAVQPELYSYPEYDTQQSIYMDLLKELNEAQAALNGASAAAMKSADNFYQGDASKWRKFANSLMLRVAMRMSKVDPAAAEQWVKTAVANGVFESDADNCMLMHAGGLTTNDSSEPYAKIYSHEDRGNFFLTEYFVDLLKSTNDPRLPECVDAGLRQPPLFPVDARQILCHGAAGRALRPDQLQTLELGERALHRVRIHAGVGREVAHRRQLAPGRKLPENDRAGDLVHELRVDRRVVADVPVHDAASCRNCVSLY